MTANAEALALHGFLLQVAQDREVGRSRSLEDYQALFPGHEGQIAAKHAELLGEADPGGGEDDVFSADARPAFIGRFRILEIIGRGGQGVVYLAEDPQLHRRVALKILSVGLGLSPEAKKRFRREAASASRLDHPGICKVFEAGEAQGVAYIAMQYVEGESLAHRIAEAQTRATPLGLVSDASSTNGATGPRTGGVLSVVHLIERVARAVHVAHQAGVIHRDLKPANIRVTPEGDPVVLDFGLAHDEESDEPTLTRSGEVFGTPAYMSPEQLKGERARIDRRTDIYALGVSLYECLTLHRPFEAPSREALYHSILEDAPSAVRSLNSRVPRDLEVVLQKALAKRPEHRYATALELAEELGRVRARQPIRTRPAGPLLRTKRWAQRNPRLATAVLGLILSLVVISALFLRTRSALELADLHLENFDSLSLVVRLEDAEAALEEALPAVPENVEPLAAWLLDYWAPVERDWPRLRATLTRLAESELDTTERFLRDTLMDLDARITAFKEEHAGYVPEDLAWARGVTEATVESYRREWESTIEAIAASPHYGGLSLPVQPGLVPLGPDPVSGLFEFYHPRSGAPDTGLPARDPQTGRFTITAEDGMVFVLLPPAEALVGAQKDDPEGAHYDPQAGHEELGLATVWIDAFFLSKYELTQGQAARLGSSRASEFPAGMRPHGDPEITLAHPVDRGFPREPLERVGLRPPLEYEWEYACRAGTSTPWYTGDGPETLAGHENIGDPTAGEAIPEWFGGEALAVDGHVVHASVGSFAPNPFGLHDMHGNVMESCARSRGKSGSVGRGGTFRMTARESRSAARHPIGLDHGSGTRLARDVRPGLFVESQRSLFEWGSYMGDLIAGDVDGDGNPDLLAVGGARAWLMSNDGLGGFTDVAATHLPPLEEPLMRVAFADVDGDGDLDLGCLPGDTVSSEQLQQNLLYLNQGHGRFIDVTVTHMPVVLDTSRALIFGDLDGDGDPDLVIGNTGGDNGERNRMHRNEGGGHFREVTEACLPPAPPEQGTEDATGALALADLDGDGDLDLVCGNRHYAWQNRVYLNQGSGVLQDVTASHLPYLHFDREPGDPDRQADTTLAIALGDVDGDGDPDLVCGNGWGARGQRNRLYLNDSSGRFREAQQDAFPRDVLMTPALALGDVDGDGDLDVVCGSGWRTRLYQNDARGRFVDSTVTHFPRIGAWTTILVDLDGDEDLDVVVGGRLLLNQSR